MKRAVRVLYALAAAALLAGCGEKTCFFLTGEPDGIREGAPVVWYNAFVGKVSAVGTEEEGAVRVEIAFDGKHADDIRDGVAARVVRDPGISPRSFVLLVGGKDASRPALGSGARIPESRPGNAVREGGAAFLEWLKTSRAGELKVGVCLLAVLCVLFKILKRLFRLAVLAVLAALVVYAVSSARSGWVGYRGDLENAQSLSSEAKDWVLRNGDKIQAVLEAAGENGE